MTAQLMELLLFAGVAFFVITKLVSIFGFTSEDDPARGNGSNSRNTDKMKDVSASAMNILDFGDIKQDTKKNLPIYPDHIFAEGTKHEVEKAIEEVLTKFPAFNLEKFVKSSKLAFQLILQPENDQELESLVDKRYVTSFKDSRPVYGNIINLENLNAKISEIYMFGNNVFVKILFSGQNVTDKINSLEEEWTFTKNINSYSADWFLTNIDQI